MKDREIEKLFIRFLNRFGKSSLNIDQLRCFKRISQESYYNNVSLEEVWSIYQCPFEECLQFLEKNGEKKIVEEMRHLPQKVEEFTKGGIVHAPNKSLSEFVFTVRINLELQFDSVYVDAIEDINLAKDDDYSFYRVDDYDEPRRISNFVPLESFDSIFDKICSSMAQPEFSIARRMTDIKAKIDPESSEFEYESYTYTVLDYFPSMFEVHLARQIGEKVTLGSVNGKPISWTIYNIDKNENAYLLLADSVLFETVGTNINEALGDCYKKYFSGRDRARIVGGMCNTNLVPLDDGKLRGNYIFLLSQLELFRLFPDTRDRSKFSEEKHIPCWLREHDDEKGIMAAVTAEGVVTELDSSETCGVRPMLWMSAF